jgi:hypothetical protein
MQLLFKNIDVHPWKSAVWLMRIFLSCKIQHYFRNSTKAVILEVKGVQGRATHLSAVSSVIMKQGLCSLKIKPLHLIALIQC